MMQVQHATTDLLLAQELTEQEVKTLLKPFGFREPEKADINLQSISKEPRNRILFSEILEDVLTAFSESPDPDMGLNNFERFIQSTFSKTELLLTLQQVPLTIYHAAFIFGGSPFLSDILIRNPEYFYWVFDLSLLKKSKTKADFRKDLRNALRYIKTKEGQLGVLRAFKRKEILRIGVRDLIKTAKVQETLKETSNLADILIEKAHEISEKICRQKYGGPALGQNSDPHQHPLAGFTIIALGKLGSRELNFSSDIDLIYLYDCREGETTQNNKAAGVHNTVYYEQLAKEITTILNHTSEEGYVYRVDLRLRPEGEMGMITLPLEGYRRYYEKRGATWERMVLLRARPVSGDQCLGRAFLELIRPFVFEKSCAKTEVLDIKAFKEKIDAMVEVRGQLHLDVKRGYGGIREIEFIVQTLQLKHGKADLRLRKSGTIQLLKCLKETGWIDPKIAKSLIKSYLFLRNVENKLQMLKDHQTHLLPTKSTEIEALALRLGYEKNARTKSSKQFQSDVQIQTTSVHEAYEGLFIHLSTP